MGLHRKRRTLLLLLFGLVYVLAFGEGYLRVFGSRHFGRPGHSYVRPPYSYDEVLGAPFRTNGLGLRGEDYAADALRIMVLGGSATECAEVPEEETWPVRMEAYLAARHGLSSAQVANAGKAGLASGHYVAHLRELAGPARIDAAVIYTGTNDADRLARYGRIQRIERLDDATYGRSFLQAFSQPDPIRLRETGGDPLSRHLLLPHFLKSFVVKNFVQPIRNRLEDLIPGRKLNDKRRRLRESPDYARVLEKAREDYAHNLSLMLGIARAEGVTPLFVTMPLMAEAPDSELAALNSALVGWCAREGIACLDLAAVPPPESGRWYPPGSHHFTTEGADRAGKLIADALAPLIKGRREDRARPRGDAPVTTPHPGNPQ